MRISFPGAKFLFKRGWLTKMLKKSGVQNHEPGNRPPDHKMETNPYFWGSYKSFNVNWQNKEKCYKNPYFFLDKPKNQIALAYKNHWEVINKLLKTKKGKCLEVGCGRGTISHFFARASHDTYLLDYSLDVLKEAKESFLFYNFNGTFSCGDACYICYKDNTFDTVISIGLLEHFEEIFPPVSEQIRVLKPGGAFIAYIVPQVLFNTQSLIKPINLFLYFFSNFLKNNSSSKEKVYRNRYSSKVYKEYLNGLGMKNINSCGLFPVPSVSYSDSFPFTLLPQEFEKTLLKIFDMILSGRKKIFKKHPWICSEFWGQAKLVWAYKVS